jgi:glycosyltransferase involved in cell wall biosynthesis
MGRRLKVLLSAYACEPEKGSEPGVGWNWAKQIARFNDVWVITRANNKEPIEHALKNEPMPNVHWVYFDLPRWLRFWKKGQRGVYLYYYLWQIGSYFVARQLHNKVKFDVAHHVTMTMDWMLSGLALLKVPFIWGAVGGSTHVVPAGIASHMPPKAILEEQIRRLVQKSMKHWDPFLRRTTRHASCILTFTRDAIGGLPFCYRNKAQPIIHIGVNSNDIPHIKVNDRCYFRTAELKVLSNGRLVYWKGHDLLIRGFARLIKDTRVNARLLITGNGPYRRQLEALIARLNVEEYVNLSGRLPHRKDVYRTLAECDLYALLTCRDGPPVSILEAMHMGRPIMCLDIGATREMVPDDAGIKLTAVDSDGLVDEIACSLSWAIAHKDRLREMGANGRRYVENMCYWDQIGQNLELLYKSFMPSTASFAKRRSR